MRLLDITTGRFVSVEDPSKVHYAILSHVWTRPGEPRYPEQTYQDVRQIQRQHAGADSVVPFFSEKVRGFCEKARADGFTLAWADTCCINKTDDEEMSEAINAMFSWYRDASACYAILSDVDYHGNNDLGYEDAFRSSRWFTRGWTLQELLAPRTTLFFSSQWYPLGSNLTLAPRIADITGIHHDILVHVKPLNEVSASGRISWAARRQTTRTEDEAYSLIGLLGIKMSISYGEGRAAFFRLQEAAVKQLHDSSIFVWGPVLPYHTLTSETAVSTSPPASSIPTPSQPRLLAETPKDFLHSSHISRLSPEVFLRRLGGEVQGFRPFTQTAFGFCARLPLLPLPSHGSHAYIAILPCRDSEERILGLLICSSASLVQANIFYVMTVVGVGIGVQQPAHIAALPKEIRINSLRSSYTMADVYISHRLPVRSAEYSDARLRATLSHGRGSFVVRQTLWSRKALLWQGYEISPASHVDVAVPSLEYSGRPLFHGAAGRSPGVVISRSGEKINVCIGRCGCPFGAHLGLLAVSASFRNPNGTRYLVRGPDDDSQSHDFGHPAHISSWTFLRSDTVMKDLALDAETTLRLTVFMESYSSSTKVLQLGVELIDTGKVLLAEEELVTTTKEMRARLSTFR